MGKFVQEVERLLEQGLQEANTRHQAMLKLCWYFRTVKGYSPEQTKQELNNWIDSKHNDKSDDYNRDPQSVYDDIKRMVDSYDLKKVKGAPKSKLTNKQKPKDFESRVVAYAKGRGVPISKSYNEVEIPSRTLRTFHRNYAPELRRLMNSRIVVKVLSYGADIGRCNRYWVKVRHIIVAFLGIG